MFIQIQSTESPWLPIELYSLIMEHISDKGDLVQLSCVSRAMQIEAERLLYANVISKPSYGLLIQRLRDIPRLHLYIRRLDLGQTNHATRDHTMEFVPYLRNLEVLRIFRGNVYYAIYELLAKCRFERLKEFTCTLRPHRKSTGSPGSDDLVYTHLATFFRGHPSIEKLCWKGPSPSPADIEKHGLISKSCLPKLTHIYATVPFLAHIIPGRPVSHIHCDFSYLQSIGKDDLQLLSSLRESTSAIVSLDAPILDPETIPALIVQNNQLRYLGLIFLDEDIFHPIFHALRSSVCLNTLMVKANYDGANERLFVSNAHAACNSLKAIWVRNLYLGDVEPFKMWELESGAWQRVVIRPSYPAENLWKTA